MNPTAFKNLTGRPSGLFCLVIAITLVNGYVEAQDEFFGTQTLPPSMPQPLTMSQDSDLNVYQPPSFFANPNINITPLESPPRLRALDLPEYQRFKQRLSDEYGFDYLFAYTPLFQLGERGRDFMDAELDFGFIWKLHDDGDTKGNLLAYMLWVHTFSDKPTGEFSQQFGVVTQPNSGGTDPNAGLVQLNVLAWEQTWMDDAISLRFGQLRNDFFFGTNKYHNDDRYVFLHTVLSGLQGINWAATGKGIGAMLDLRGDEFYTTLAFGDAKADQRHPDFNSFVDGRFHYLAEVGWTPTFGESSEGEYKLSLSHTARTGDPNDVGLREGQGLIISARQDINKKIGISGRWNKSFKRFNGGLRESLATGFTFTGIGDYKDDWISIGYFCGKPIDRSLRNEHGMEVYWRAQLTKTIELTPDFQVYFQRARRSGAAYFGSIRIRIVL